MELTEREQAKQTEYCMQLKQKVESLKDYPLRRTTAREYYNQECQR